MPTVMHHHVRDIEEVCPKTGRALTKYVKGKLLGKGGFAKCYEVTESGSGRVLAAKIVEKKTLTKSKTQQKLKSEIKIHSSLHHPRIVRFEKYFEDAENVYIILELCAQQTLMELQKRKRRLTEPEAAYILLQTIEGVKYMHSRNIIHRDLKLGNLLLTDKMEIKIGDFGLAAQIEFDGERKLYLLCCSVRKNHCFSQWRMSPCFQIRTVCGTPNYIAPEILDGGKHGHSFEVDIWSIGVILFTLLVGKPPFETTDIKTTYRKIRSLNYSFPDSIEISSAAKALIQRILQSCPESRPTLDEIENDVWFRLTKAQKTAPGTLFPHVPTSKVIPVVADNQKDVKKDIKRVDALGGGIREPLRPLTNAGGVDILITKPSPRISTASPRNRQSPRTARPSTNDLLRHNDGGLRRLSSEVDAPLERCQSARERDRDPNLLPSTFHRRETFPSSSSNAKPTQSTAVGTQAFLPHKPESVRTPSAAGFAAHIGAEQGEVGKDVLDDDEKKNLTQMQNDISACIQNNNNVPMSTRAMAAAAIGSARVHHHDNAASPSPSSKPSVWVCEYSDFSAKYGLCYRLSYGHTGAVFNDGTKMIWDDVSGRVEYYSRNRETPDNRIDERLCCTVDNYPETLKKKITLITYFRSYFAKYKGKNVTYPIVTANPLTNTYHRSSASPTVEDSSSLVFVKQWVRHSHAMVFRLSNRCFQVAFFDGADILLSCETRMVTYTDPNGHSQTLSLDARGIAVGDLAERLEYTQTILHHILQK